MIVQSSFSGLIKVYILSPQVDFGSLRKVTRVATQGSYGSAFPFYVESFQFKYSNNSIDWMEYSENGIAKVRLRDRACYWHGPKGWARP